MKKINLDKAFVIATICRKDLIGSYTLEQVADLTDADMKRIASKMGDSYLDMGYWEDMEAHTDNVFEKKYEKTNN